MVLETDHIVQTGTKISIGEEETLTIEVVTEITGLIIGITVGPKIETITEMVTGTRIDQIIEGKTVTKGVVTEIRTVADLWIEIVIGGLGVAPEKVPNLEALVGPKTDMKIEGRVEMIPEKGTGLNQDLDTLLA